MDPSVVATVGSTAVVSQEQQGVQQTEVKSMKKDDPDEPNQWKPAQKGYRSQRLLRTFQLHKFGAC